jgi:hypothetical protein
MNFMLPVPEASFPAVDICSETSEAGISFLSYRDTVVLQHNNFKFATDAGIVVHIDPLLW